MAAFRFQAFVGVEERRRKTETETEKDGESRVLAIVYVDVRGSFQGSLLVFSPYEIIAVCFSTTYAKPDGPRPPGESPADASHLNTECWDYR